VNGSVVPPSPVKTDVELTVGPNEVEVPWPATVDPATCFVLVVVWWPIVVLVEPTTVDPETSLVLVVVSATVEVVSSCGCVVVVEHLQVVGGWYVVVVHSHVVVGTCVVVVSWH
jgi:hypothetical protein